MIEPKTVKYYGDGYFWVKRDEVADIGERFGCESIGDSMRLIFPRLVFFKCSKRCGYYGRFAPYQSRDVLS